MTFLGPKISKRKTHSSLLCLEEAGGLNRNWHLESWAGVRSWCWMSWGWQWSGDAFKWKGDGRVRCGPASTPWHPKSFVKDALSGDRGASQNFSHLSSSLPLCFWTVGALSPQVHPRLLSSRHQPRGSSANSASGCWGVGEWQRLIDSSPTSEWLFFFIVGLRRFFFSFFFVPVDNKSVVSLKHSLRG